jgi:ABC-type transport system substrate-binding protein
VLRLARFAVRRTPEDDTRRRAPGRGRAALAGLALVAAAACSGDSEGDLSQAGDATTEADAPAGGEPVVGGTLRIGLSPIESLDPAAASPAQASASVVADLLYDGLTTVAPGATSATPALAESWQAFDGATRWHFTLRAGVMFSDGRPIAPDDVAYSLGRVARLGAGSLLSTRLDVVQGARELAGGAAPTLAGVTVVDPTTVEIRLTQPLSSLPELLAAPALGIVARPGDAGVGVGATVPPAAGVTSGPFRLAGDEGGVLTLARALGRAPLLDGIEVHFQPDLGVALEALEAGSLDWSLVPPDRLDEATERFGSDLVTPFQAELFYGFNLAIPAFVDARFRVAIVRAVDREAIIAAVYRATASPLIGVVPDGVAGAVGEGCGATCAYDPDAARALVAEVFGAGPVPEVVVGFDDGPDEAAVAGAIADGLVAAGIPATLRPVPAAEYGAFATSGQQQLFRLGWIGTHASPDAYLHPLFASGSPDNIVGFTDPAVDDLLARARATEVPADRLALYAEAERLVLAQAPVLPIAQFRTLAVAAPQVQDLAFGIDGTFAAEQTWLAPG